MPKILRITNRLNIGGPTYNVAYLTKYLAPEFDTLLLTGMRDTKEGSSEHILQQFDLSARIIPHMQREVSPYNDFLAYREIRKVIREFKPDIVHTHMSKPGATGRMAAIHEHVPVILHTFHGHVFHSYFSPMKTKFFQKVEQYLASKTTGIIAISDLQKKELTEEFNICHPDKAHTIRLGFDLSRFQESMPEKRTRFREEWKIQTDEIAIGIIGRLVPVKNHRFFLDAIRQVLTVCPDKKVKVFIVGDGELRSSLESYCRELQLAYDTENEISGNHPVVFTSWILQADEVVAGMDIIALSSFNEGTPVSLIEAQAAGVPIVTTDAGGIRDVVKENETALIAEQGDMAQFSNHLVRLIREDELRKMMAQKGPEHAITHFHYRSLVENMRQLYRKLLDSRNYR